MPIRIYYSIVLWPLIFYPFSAIVWVALLFLVFLHELGHTFMAKQLGVEVTSIDLFWAGGLTRFNIKDIPKHKLWSISCGGVMVQSIVLFLTCIPSYFLRNVHSYILSQLFLTFINLNILIIVFNLFPIPLLDGWWIWTLFPAFLKEKR